MLCPLKYPAYDASSDILKWLNCEGSDCAWWIDERRRCAIHQLSIQMRILADSFFEDCEKEREELEDFINELDC